MKKLAIITTHPVQYYAPVFKLLAESLDLKVFYTWGETSQGPKYDPGFGKIVAWDIPLLDGYNYEFLKNTSKDPGSHHFQGIVNPGIINEVKNFLPDAILVYGWSYSSHLKVLRHFKGSVPVYFRGDSNLLDLTSNWKQIARKLLLKWVYSNVDSAFYVGTANKLYFKAYGLKENQLIFAPHATDNARFAQNQYGEANEVRRKLGVENNEVLLLFAGKLESKKDPLLLLEAYKKLNNEKVKLLFVGNGPLEKDLKERASVIKDHVHFVDFQNQQAMPIFYQACDLFCLPSAGPGETWGLAVNEAMAAGKAVMVSDRVGCAIDLVKQENGTIFRAGDVEDLTVGLRKACASKEVLMQLGEKSKEIISEWSFERQAAIIINALTNGG